MDKSLFERLKDNLGRLRLYDMIDELDNALNDAEKERMGYISFLDRLVSKQVSELNSRSYQRRIKKACLDEDMSFDHYDFNFQPTLNVEQVKDLAELGFISNRRPVLIFGKPGSGKTHIASGLGIRACQQGYKVRFYELQALLNKLYATLADDTTDQLILKLVRLDLLILDGAGYIRSKPEYPSLLFDLVNACRNRVALIVTTNLSFQQWGETLGNLSFTNAIVDRLFHKAHFIDFTKAKSYCSEGPHAPQNIKKN